MTEKERQTLQAVADGYRESMTWRGLARQVVATTFKTCVLWVVPFALLWSVGVDPVLAAWVAIGPMACVFSGSVILIAIGSIFIAQIVEDEMITTKDFHKRRRAKVLSSTSVKWQTTREIADATPWAVLTVIQILRTLEVDGLVESRKSRGEKSLQWRTNSKMETLPKD